MRGTLRTGVGGVLLALTEWMQQSASASARPNTGSIVSVLVCTSYQTLLVTRLLVAGGALDGNAYALTRDWNGALAIASVTVGAAVLLLWRPWRPLTVLGIECALYATASAMEMSNYLVFPLLFALFSCLVRLPARQVAAAAGLVWTAMTFSAFVSNAPGGFVPEYLGQLVTAITVTALAVATRSVRGWQHSRKRAVEEELRVGQLARQRDRVLSRARVAAELHDSVGHGLTTIIALSEGLTGTTGDDMTDEALAGINAVARTSLAETRRAVRALSGLDDDGEAVDRNDAPLSGEGTSSQHEWAEILPVLDHVRSLGASVSFSESGRRPLGARHADLCFAVTREAVTNAMRHSIGLQRIAVSWDHDDGVTTVTARSTDDSPSRLGRKVGGHSSAGTGLLRLRRKVANTGGTMSYGWVTDGEWVVRAVVRSRSSQAVAASASHPALGADGAR